jgi:cytochrome oxidase Cu insertion factor (SCO1/SenC/PrrC family)
MSDLEPENPLEVVRRRDFKRLLIAAGVLAVAAAIPAGLWLRHEPWLWEKGKGALQIGGPFALIDGDGHAVTERSFPGKWLLIYFGYTYCPDVCPTSLNRVAEALDRLGPDGAEIQPLFITVDPERDTPAMLRDYVKAFDPRLIGLTGSPEAIAAAAKAYRVYYRRTDQGSGASDYLIDHSALTYLVDPQGAVVAYFSHNDSAESMAATIRKLINP